MWKAVRYLKWILMESKTWSPSGCAFPTLFFQVWALLWLLHHDSKQGDLGLSGFESCKTLSCRKVPISTAAPVSGGLSRSPCQLRLQYNFPAYSHRMFTLCVLPTETFSSPALEHYCWNKPALFYTNMTWFYVAIPAACSKHKCIPIFVFLKTVISVQVTGKFPPLLQVPGKK